MITTMGDAFRVELPAGILRAQARITKIILERGLPTRLVKLSAYLVSITSLKRGGRVHLSRARVAELMGVSERTIDRHLDEMESSGLLARLVRSRTPGGYFFGTCVKWGESVWNEVFVQPGRTRTEAIGRTREMVSHKNVECVNAAHISEVPTEANEECKQAKHTPNHATFVTHYSSPITKVVDKGLIFVKEPQASPTSKHTGQVSGFKPPKALLGWIQRLRLNANQVSLLMTIAKRTDVNKTRTRLQDLLNHVGERLLAGAILADQASKYLYKCLASGEDYSPARFVNSMPGTGHEDKEIADARALRKALPEGKTTVIAGQALVRQDLVVYRVVDGTSSGARPLTREQMAVLARRAGLC